MEISECSEIDVLEEDPAEVAGQLSHLDHEALKVIPVSELLNKNFMDPAKSPYFHKMAETWNKVNKQIGAIFSFDIFFFHFF